MLLHDSFLRPVHVGGVAISALAVWKVHGVIVKPRKGRHFPQARNEKEMTISMPDDKEIHPGKDDSAEKDPKDEKGVHIGICKYVSSHMQSLLVYN